MLWDKERKRVLPIWESPEVVLSFSSTWAAYNVIPFALDPTSHYKIWSERFLLFGQRSEWKNRNPRCHCAKLQCHLVSSTIVSDHLPARVSELVSQYPYDAKVWASGKRPDPCFPHGPNIMIILLFSAQTMAKIWFRAINCWSNAWVIDEKIQFKNYKSSPLKILQKDIITYIWHA